MGEPGPFHVEMDRLAHLGPALQGLADEAARLSSDLPMCPIPGTLEPAVLEASEIARDVVDSALVSALKERLSETGEIMVNVANQFRNADEEALKVAADTYTKATGDWLVPEAPKSSGPDSESPPPSTSTPKPAVRKYTVVSGDTLWAISDRFYGDPKRYQPIADASGVSDPDRIYHGQVLTIPDAATSDRPENKRNAPG
jgi:nucleoid-associated protein YgaU